MSLNPVPGRQKMPEFSYVALPVDLEAAKRPRFSDADFGRWRYAEPKRYRHDPEAEQRDRPLQQKRVSLR